MNVDSNISPLISIIMPAYNRANLILETIDSIRNQTYANWELIIMDDGSDDNTEELIKQLNEQRIHYCKEARTGWVSKLKNTALTKTRGSLIAFADSDDLWARDKLEKQLAAFKQYPDAGFCLTGGYNFRKLNEPVEFFYKQDKGLRYGDLFIPFFKSEVSATMPTFIFKKQCLDIVGSFDESKPFTDTDFILRMTKAVKGIILYEHLFYRRLHDANDSDTDWEKGSKEGVQLIRRYEDALPGEVVREALYRLYVNAGENYIKNKKRSNAVGQFWNAWKEKPFSIIPVKKMIKALIS